MKQDDEAPRGGYSTNPYIKCLEEGLLPIYGPGTIFQQDNAKIHRLMRMQEWFENHVVWVMEWPPYSPDLNPIEHCWNLLKEKLIGPYPRLFMAGKSQINWTEFHEAIRAAWWAIPQATINALIDPMLRRIEAVYRVRGWYTKY